MDLHNYKRRFERTLERIEESDISADDKEVIWMFKDYCLTQNISWGKTERYLGDIVKLSRMLNRPIRKATKQDLMKVVAELNQSELSESTKQCFKILLRKLYKLLRGIEGKGGIQKR